MPPPYTAMSWDKKIRDNQFVQIIGFAQSNKCRSENSMAHAAPGPNALGYANSPFFKIRGTPGCITHPISIEIILSSIKETMQPTKV